jgi:hypothetical protein
VFVVGRRGIDFVGYGPEAVCFDCKSGLGMFHAFDLRTIATLTPATAAAPAAAAAGLFAILARAAGLAMRLTMNWAMNLAMRLTIGLAGVVTFRMIRAF